MYVLQNSGERYDALEVMALRTDSCNHGAARRERLASLIRLARRSIRPDVTMLGPFRRLENRIGRSISQDEAAEACGISRQWYGGLEQGAPIRMSITTLTRIADVLMVDGARRRELFTLSFPELTFLPEIDNVVQIDERLPAAKAIADRLGSATTELEALAITADAFTVLLRLVEAREMQARG